MTSLKSWQSLPWRSPFSPDRAIRWGWQVSHLYVHPMNVALILWQRLDDLWTDDQFFLNHHKHGIIIVNSWVVGARSNRDKIIRESLNAIWAHWMRSNHHVKIVSLKERVQIVNTKIHNIILFLRISNVVMLESCNIITLMRVTPEEINNLLMMLDMIWSEFNFERSLNFFNAFNICNCRTQTTMAAEYSLLLISYDRC